jgi:biotin-[acetyl-CoA-carboxylase] ligase BirA-like protein
LNLVSGFQTFDEVSSTMEVATRALCAGNPIGTIVARTQTAGRGRLQRKWHSPPGDSLSMTLTLAENPGPDGYLIGLAIGCLVAEVCDTQLRWPNDLVMGDGLRKVGGILTEVVEGHFLVGIGLNLNQTEFPEDISPFATSLRLETGQSYVAESLAAEIAEAVRRAPRPTAFSFLLSSWSPRDRTPGKKYRTVGGELVVAEYVNELGELVTTTGQRITAAEALFGK